MFYVIYYNCFLNLKSFRFVLVFCACLLMLTLFGRIVIISSNTDLNQIPHSIGLFRQPSIAPSQSRLETQKLTDFEKNFGTVNELDGCYHVYLDVGSNVGIQVRKLFEQKLYPNAKILAVFESYFGPADDKGNRQETVCAVGFEPNARHTPALQDVEQAHKVLISPTFCIQLFFTKSALHSFSLLAIWLGNFFGEIISVQKLLVKNVGKMDQRLAAGGRTSTPRRRPPTITAPSSSSPTTIWATESGVVALWPRVGKPQVRPKR
jgi:hypothetical protein